MDEEQRKADARGFVEALRITVVPQGVLDAEDRMLSKIRQYLDTQTVDDEPAVPVPISDISPGDFYHKRLEILRYLQPEAGEHTLAAAAWAATEITRLREAIAKIGALADEAYNRSFEKTHLEIRNLASITLNREI